MKKQLIEIFLDGIINFLKWFQKIEKTFLGRVIVCVLCVLCAFGFIIYWLCKNWLITLLLGGAFFNL